MKTTSHQFKHYFLKLVPDLAQLGQDRKEVDKDGRKLISDPIQTKTIELKFESAKTLAWACQPGPVSLGAWKP